MNTKDNIFGNKTEENFYQNNRNIKLFFIHYYKKMITLYTC